MVCCKVHSPGFLLSDWSGTHSKDDELSFYHLSLNAKINPIIPDETLLFH